MLMIVMWRTGMISSIYPTRGQHPSDNLATMKHILLPTDLSACALNAAAFAFDLFGTSDTKYTLLHAYYAVGFNDPFLPEVPAAIQRSSQEELEEFSKRCLALRPGERPNLTRVVSFGALTGVVRDTCTAEDVDMIVMGTRGKSGASLFGSTTSELVKHALVPVIAVPDQWKSRPLRKILFADDHGEMDGQIVAPMMQLAVRTGATVTMAHVRRELLVEAGGEDLRAKENPLAGVPHSFVTVADDHVPEALDKLAIEGDMDMIAIIRRDLGVLDSLLHRSMARKMALHTHLPLLVMNAKV